MGVAYSPIKYKELEPDHQSLGGRSRAEARTVSQSQLDLQSEQLLNSYREYNEREDLGNLLEARAKLPISIYADRILNLVSESPFSIDWERQDHTSTSNSPRQLYEVKRRCGVQYSVHPTVNSGSYIYRNNLSEARPRAGLGELGGVTFAYHFQSEIHILSLIT